jgi:hypothetical protein
MEINRRRIKVRDIATGYLENKDDNSVVAYRGKLDVRPKFQREFVYDDKKRDAVVMTVLKEFPLNIMYWSKQKDDQYEMIDGQQRTISICRFIQGGFSVKIKGNNMFFHNLTEEEKNTILEYPLDVFVCEGGEREKLEWFEVINIAGEKLTQQELRNAVYAGTWLTDAKTYFSRTNCPAYRLAKQYMSGSPIRQDYLEKVLKWKADTENKSIEDYMSEHQNDPDAYELWEYFQAVIDWVKAVFPKYHKEMKGIDWGILYNEAKDRELDPNKLQERIEELMLDDDVTKKKGIWEYLITGNESKLSIRAFSEGMKRQKYEEQQGKCARCGESFTLDKMEGDHIIPWSEGGKTTLDNLQMLCKDCNRRKSNK